MIFDAENPRAPSGVCTWCEEEQTLSPQQLMELRGGGATVNEQLYRLLLPGGG